MRAVLKKRIGGHAYTVDLSRYQLLLLMSGMERMMISNHQRDEDKDRRRQQQEEGGLQEHGRYRSCRMRFH